MRARRYGEHGIRVIASVYPNVIKELRVCSPAYAVSGSVTRTIEHRGKSVARPPIVSIQPVDQK